MNQYRIRNATINDLDEITELEKICFPTEEAASKSAFCQRLSYYPNHFWLLEINHKIVSMVNGMVTDEANLKDDMYSNAQIHNEQGKWQMIFGVETHPDYQRNGWAAILLRQIIEKARIEGRAGLVLTCKEKLIHYYEKFGFINEGISSSEHGHVVWYQMRLTIN